MYIVKTGYVWVYIISIYTILGLLNQLYNLIFGGGLSPLDYTYRDSKIRLADATYLIIT